MSSFGPITHEIVNNSFDPYLVDYQGEGEILVISFGFLYGGGNASIFDFYNRLQKVESLTGRKINKLLLRDVAGCWYHQGVGGLGSNVDETVAGIRRIIAEVKPSQVITVGQSMGAYAAIMFGALLGIDKVLAFGPLSCLDPLRLELMADRRWLSIIRQMNVQAMPVHYDDLPKLLRAVAHKPRVEIFYGTRPDEQAIGPESVNLDAAHALQFYGIENVKLSVMHYTTHLSIDYLRRHKLMSDLMANRLFGDAPRTQLPSVDITADWMLWLEENLQMGCYDSVLLKTLVDANFAPDSASHALDIAKASLTYRSLFA